MICHLIDFLIILALVSFFLGGGVGMGLVLRPIAASVRWLLHRLFPRTRRVIEEVDFFIGLISVGIFVSVLVGARWLCSESTG